MKTYITTLLIVLSLGLSGHAQTSDTKKTVIEVNTLSEFKTYLNQDNVHVKLKAGNYQIDDAEKIRFLEFTGHNSYYDLKGVRFMVDTKLFSRTDLVKSDDGNDMYCAIEISGKHITLEGLYIETYGDTPGHQSKNKMFNIVGEYVVLKDVELRTAGSNPWGYGYLYGISGGSNVRKMNGIRVGYPAKNVKLLGCKVHMRAMGHGIFLQGSVNTLIEGCEVDGLLRTTDAMLAETSGFGFDKNFYAAKGNYIEGTNVAEDGKILPGEIISLSEDGIRMYPDYKGHLTKNTTVKNCTVTQMRRGICTGLSTSGDMVIDCVVRDCVATGYNVGNEDVLINCSADAKYGEAFCIAYTDAKNASVDMTILDSRDGLANNLLAKINGTGHTVNIRTEAPEYIPDTMAIKLSVWEGYGNFDENAKMHATDITLNNQTDAEVITFNGTTNLDVKSVGEVREATASENVINEENRTKR
ncbi:right-handed parallel beta-helix repeat-containing protein [Formosa sp. PL04]|uniref:right-handed parallel beta-helix repeat-containing protein n=1 Tax=Formosa sp. PL04 TaxID=3081755 RepID=UPI002981BDC2|nr:right-handed parallel beta-helix repeat-containing protein [Formosa sp. PL04]MDW5290299.1 right-handed parallel beta-helix repeat-containing protein [Formosa sp. PL04]